MDEYTLADDRKLLQSAKQDLEKQKYLKKQKLDKEVAFKEMDKALEARKRMVAEQIANKTKKSKEQMQNFYTEQKAKKQQELKHIQVKRQEDKEKGIEKRIKEETRPLKEESRHLAKLKGELFKKNKVSRFWNNKLYYAFVSPSCLSDWLIILASFFVYLFMIPSLLASRVFHFSAFWQFIILYIVFLVVFILVYSVIIDRIKTPHEQLFAEVRKIRKKELVKKREIKVLICKIKKDKNENMYSLEKYDESIAEVEKQLTQIQEESVKVYEQFEKETKVQIADEIWKEHQDELRKLIDNKDELREQLEELQKEINQSEINFTEDYIRDLGEAYITEERIQALDELLETGRAHTLQEAKSMLNMQSN